MPTTIRLLFCVLVSFALPANAERRCLQTADVAWLEKLAVSACLYGNAAKPPAAATATEFRQTLRNIGKSTIVLELPKDVTWLFHLQIYLDGREVSRRERRREGDERPIEYRFVELAPGEQTEIRHAIADLMTERPQAGKKYDVVQNAYFGFRAPDEPAGSGLTRRAQEAAEKEAPLPWIRFEGVEIR
jgi:hypothetical protein